MGFKLVNTTGFSSGIWHECEATRVDLGFSCAGVADGAAAFVPAGFWTTDACTIASVVLQATTNCLFTITDARIARVSHSRVSDDVLAIGLDGVASGNWNMTYATNAPVPKLMVVTATGFDPTLVKAATVLTGSAGNTISGTALPTSISITRSVALGSVATVAISGIFTGAVTKS
jgi:hypothetical protein